MNEQKKRFWEGKTTTDGLLSHSLSLAGKDERCWRERAEREKARAKNKNHNFGIGWNPSVGKFGW